MANHEPSSDHRVAARQDKNIRPNIVQYLPASTVTVGT